MKLTRNEIAAIKRVAMTVQPLLKKKDKINDQIIKLVMEKDKIDEDIKVWEQGIRNMTGKGIEELVEKEMINGNSRYKVREDILEVEEEKPEIEKRIEETGTVIDRGERYIEGISEVEAEIANQW